MSKGGARNRSGPAPDPASGRSDRRGVKLTALPSEGYRGEIPAWPLPKRSAYIVGRDEGGKPVRQYDSDETEAIAERELTLWGWAWRTPQAAAWAMPSESWRLHTVAMWVRTFVLCESSEATAADKGSLHRFADQIGLSPAGLKESGWAIAVDEVAARAADRPASEAGAPQPARRLRSADAQ